MGIETQIQLFDNAKIRVAWDDEKEKYFFSVVDVIGVLTESADGRTYWKVLKNRLLKEGNETVTNCNQLKLPASDGKMRLTDVADLEGILRIVQSVPSKKAEPIKQWLAQVGSERIHQMIDPERSIQQAVADYKKLGYSDKWIANRVKSIDARNELTNEWKRSGMTEGRDFAILTDLITKTWSGKTTKEYLFEDYNFVMDFLPQPATLPPYISDLTGEVMEFTTSMVSTVIIFLAIFLAVKIILTLLLSLFTRNDRESFAGKINSFFGMLADFLKGYIVVSIILFAMLPLAQFVSADFLIQCQNQIDTSYIAKEIYNTNILPILIKGFTVI